MKDLFSFEHRFLGYEFDWLACDDTGHVAFMASAGFGPIPTQYVDDESIFDGLFEEIEQIPVSCDDYEVNRFDKVILGSADIARRGFYAFDWNHSEKRYLLEAIPDKPVLVDQLANLGVTVNSIFCFPCAIQNLSKSQNFREMFHVQRSKNKKS